MRVWARLIKLMMSLMIAPGLCLANSESSDQFTEQARAYLSAIHFKEKVPEQIKEYVLANFLSKAELIPAEVDELLKAIKEAVEIDAIDKRMETDFFEVYQGLGFEAQDMKHIFDFIQTPSGQKFQTHELAIIQQLNQKSEAILLRYSQKLNEIVDKIHIKAMERRAKSGDLEAAYQLYHFYLLGKGTTKNTDMALAFLKQSARGGYALAQNNLGYHYVEGDILKKDPERAVYWYHKAAKQQNSVAMTNLAQQYFHGYASHSPDYQQAFKYYHQAAMYGDYCAQFALAHLYAKGLHVKKNEHVAKDWFVASALAGLPDQFAIGQDGALLRYAQEFAHYALAKITHKALPKLDQDQLLMFDQFEELNVERCL